MERRVTELNLNDISSFSDFEGADEVVDSKDFGVVDGSLGRGAVRKGKGGGRGEGEREVGEDEKKKEKKKTISKKVWACMGLSPLICTM